MADIVSRPYQPNSDVCCEACVFHRGEHADWCAKKAPAVAPGSPLCRVCFERPMVGKHLGMCGPCRGELALVDAIEPAADIPLDEFDPELLAEALGDAAGE